MTAAVAPLPARFARLVKIEHTVFALPFAYVGAFLAVDAVPSAHDLLWITLARDGAEPADRPPDRRAQPTYGRTRADERAAERRAGRRVLRRVARTLPR